MSEMVCPECGNNIFEQRATARVKLTVCFYGEGRPYPTDQAEEIEDLEREDEIVCRDCGWEVEDARLVTRQQFDDLEVDDDYR